MHIQKDQDHLIESYLARLERSKVENPISFTNFAAYREKGGEVYDDMIRSERQFLFKYCVIRGDFFYINPRYEAQFTAFGAVVYNNTVTIPLPESFFWYRGMKVLLLMPAQKLEKEKIEKKENTVEELMEVDFLCLYNPTRNVLFEDNELQRRYIAKVKEVFSKEVIIRHYTAYLRRNALDTKVSSTLYDNPYEFINTSDKQHGTYFEVLHKIHEVYPQDKMFFYFDGIGTCSMIANVLRIEYNSMEMNEIGRIAYELGIITDFTSDHGIYDQEDGIHVFCNLSAFMSVSHMYSKKKFVIIDENRLFKGVELRYVQWSSQGKVHHNLDMDDNFISFPREISKSLPMLKKKQNVPLGGKAEFYLLANGLLVYSDGEIQTITPSVLVDKKPHYIDTTDSGRELKRQGLYDYLTVDVLNIVTRSRPTIDVGRLGDLKRRGEIEYPYGMKEFFVNTYSAFKILFKTFDDPRCLHSFIFQDGFYFALQDERPERIRYLIDSGEVKFIMFLHTVKLKGKAYNVFRDRELYQNVQHIPQSDE